jgi:hypothetical protein
MEIIMDSALKRNRTQNDQRIVEEADHKGYHIRVVCGYSAIHDQYFVHLYLVPPAGPEERMFNPPETANTLDEGFEHAFNVALSEIDKRVL